MKPVPITALAVGLVAALLLGACATPATDAPRPAAPVTAPSPPQAPPAAVRPAPVEEKPVPSEAAAPGPEQRNYTGAPSLLLTGQDQWGEYYSAVLKLSFNYDTNGKLTLAKDPEPVIDGDSPEDQDSHCRAYGGGMNQRTTWFPDTGLFVRGGTLRAIRVPGSDGSLRSMPLLALSPSERVYMMVVGKQARKLEMAYVPCVGDQRVSAGHRTQQFVPLGATLDIVESAGKRLQLTLPTSPAPFLLLRYRSGALIPSPMRIVVATVDTQRKRLVLQFQSTAFVKPDIRVIEWRALAEGDQPGDGETVARYRERRDATAADLAKCPLPFHPPEPCATENRRPDPRIFSPQ